MQYVPADNKQWLEAMRSNKKADKEFAQQVREVADELWRRGNKRSWRLTVDRAVEIVNSRTSGSKGS